MEEIAINLCTFECQFNAWVFNEHKNKIKLKRKQIWKRSSPEIIYAYSIMYMTL